MWSELLFPFYLSRHSRSATTWPVFLVIYRFYLDMNIVELKRCYGEPTPCNPPETLYPPPPNFPPAWKIVRNGHQQRDVLSFWISTQEFRPSITTFDGVIGSIKTWMWLANPARASSIELSTISHTRWWRPSFEVDQYVPGRIRTKLVLQNLRNFDLAS